MSLDYQIVHLKNSDQAMILGFVIMLMYYSNCSFVECFKLLMSSPCLNYTVIHLLQRQYVLPPFHCF